MVRKRFSNRSFVTIFCLFLIFAPVNYPIVTWAQIAPVDAQSPAIKIESREKKPNAVRRFFSAVFNRIAGVFRRERRLVHVLPPVVNLTASHSLITYCPTTRTYAPNSQVGLSANSEALDDGESKFTFAVTGGRLSDSGGGKNVTWDLSGVPEGVYTATVEMDDGRQHVATASATIKITSSPSCDKGPPPCPTVSVSSPK